MDNVKKMQKETVQHVKKIHGDAQSKMASASSSIAGKAKEAAQKVKETVQNL